MSLVNVSRYGRVAIVSFDRGTAANPLSHQLMRELIDAARSFDDDFDTSAVILTGRSDNFCMGFDLADPETQRLRQAGLSDLRHAVTLGKRMCQAWEDIAPLTISAIEGWCVGGGVALSVATDLRVISDQARFYVPEVERGLNMSWGSVPRITNLVGPARAKRMILLAEQLNADCAENWGLADRVTPPGMATDVARDMAERVAGLPPVAVRMSKQSINAYANALAGVASHADADQFALAFGSKDAKEGINAFFEKRPPDFTGD